MVAQFALLAGLAFLPLGPTCPPPTAVRAVGLVLVALALVWGVAGGLALGRSLRAMPLPAAGAVLRTTGVYAVSRHPIYGALLVGASGLVLRSGSSVRVVVTALLAVLLHAKASFEEEALERVFPSYPSYAARTGRFFPRRRRPGPGSTPS